MAGDVNGNTVPMAVWLINAALGLITLLLGAVLRQHAERDNERHNLAWEEIIRLRDTVHKLRDELPAKIAALHEHYAGRK